MDYPLDDDAPLIAHQFDDFMYHGFGASEDNAAMMASLKAIGLPQKIVDDIMWRIVHPRPEMIYVRREDANNYSLILTALGMEEEGDPVAAVEELIAARYPLNAEPVEGDVLPPIGSRVFIRHGRDEDAHACIVTGYYAWKDLGGNPHLHRVSVRLVYEGTTTPNARSLNEVWPTREAALARCSA